MSIVVTCAVSLLGRRLTDALLNGPGGSDLILVDPEPQRLDRAIHGKARVRHGDLGDPLSLAAAFAGARTIVLPGGIHGPMEPGLAGDVMDMARAAGAERVVLFSSIDPRAANPAAWAAADRAAEAAVRASTLGWTILRTQESLEAFITAGRRQQAGGRMFNNRDYGRSAPVALDDVTAAAAAVIPGASHNGRIYELTGPRLIGSGDLAGALGIDFIPHKDHKYFDQLISEDQSVAEAEKEVALGRAVRAGYYAVVTDDVEALTGRKARDLHDAVTRQIALIGSQRFLREIARIMARRGVASRLMLGAPDPAALDDLVGEGCVVRRADLDHPASLATAFAGCVTLCLPGGGEGALTAVQARNALEAAKAAGVERVVLMSSTNAEAPGNRAPTAARDRAVELAVQDSGMAWTVLRLQERLEDFVGLARSHAKGDVLSTNRAHGRNAPIALSDAAEAACVVLLDHSHAGRFYNLTGPRLYGIGDLAHGLGLRIGSERRPDRLDKMFAAQLAPADVGQLGLGQAVREGVHEVATDDVARLTGRAPMDLHDFLNL